jgi:hypothetical protein
MKATNTLPLHPEPPIVRQLTGEAAAESSPAARFCGQSAVPRPRRSHVHLLGDRQGIVNLDAEVAHRAFDFGIMPRSRARRPVNRNSPSSFGAVLK